MISIRKFQKNGSKKRNITMKKRAKRVKKPNDFNTKISEKQLKET